ncbi:MAG: hypothetical protein WD069_10105 [Planctomycetales bacterium]
MHSFPCPHCSAPLRIRDRSLFERPLDCPDCGEALRVEPDGRHGIRVLKADPQPAATGEAGDDGSLSPTRRRILRRRPSKAQRARSAGRRASAGARAPSKFSLAAAGVLTRVRHAVLNPVGISWLAAGAAGLGLLLAIQPWRSDAPTSAASPDANAVAVAAEGTRPPAQAGEPVPSPPVAGKPEPPQARPDVPPGAGPADDRPAEQAVLPPAPPALAERPPPAEPIEPAPNVGPPEPPAIAADDLPEALPIPNELLPAQPPEPPQTIDVVRALAQPIVKFEQSRAVAVVEALALVAEMTAVPIRVDRAALGASAPALDRPITLALENTTAGAILDAIVEKAGLTYDIHADGIDVRPRGGNPGDGK